MNTEKKIKWLTRIGWFFFALSVLSFLGLLERMDNEQAIYDSFKSAVFSEWFSIPDFKTILLAGISAAAGWAVVKLRRKQGLSPKKGKRLIIAGAVCIALTFTPLSIVSIFPAAVRMGNDDYFVADGYEDVDPQLYEVYAFVGSGESRPEDVDLWDYLSYGYDGHAKGVYETYKVCGWLKNVSDTRFRDIHLEIVLVDEDGNDILIDGQTAVLTLARGRLTNNSHSLGPNCIEGFQTETVKAEDLSAQPVQFRVLRIQQGIYLSFFDEVEE